MNIKLRRMALMISLVFLGGCVAYAPPPYQVTPMAAPYMSPYGGYGYGYNYGYAPVVPFPYFRGGWGWGHGGGFRGGYGGFRHH